MRIGFDATPLLGARTGIGRYTLSLMTALAASGTDELVATAFTFRGRGGLSGVVPPGVRVAARPAPARGLQALWARTEWPPVELLSGGVDVFHAPNYVLPPLRRARGVVTIHDLAYLRHPETVTAATARYEALVPRSLQRASAVVADSQTVAEQLSAEYDVQVPLVVAPLGVDPAWFEARPPDDDLRSRLGLGSSYLVFVGSLEPRKDLRTLLAAHRLMAEPPPLVLVGPPGWGEQVDVTGCITPGYLSEDALRSVVAGASALVLPSVDEGFGLPVLEALAAGTPVVASDLPVLREVGGSMVSYAEVGGAASFAAALEAVLDDPGDATARRAQAAPFTWERCATLTREAYELARQA